MLKLKEFATNPHTNTIKISPSRKKMTPDRNMDLYKIKSSRNSNTMDKYIRFFLIFQIFLKDN